MSPDFSSTFNQRLMVMASLFALVALAPISLGFNLDRNLDKKIRLTTQIDGMKRPILDQIASTLFDLETKRVKDSSVVDEKGRIGEPMEWSTKESLANKFSQIMTQGPGYQFKQFVANIVAGDYDDTATIKYIEEKIKSDKVVMFSFTTCPFCRRAKDMLEDQGIPYSVVELDELPGNTGNEIRASLGKMTKRTSVPNIFIKQSSIGGLNDGMPGLVALIESNTLLQKLEG